MSMRIITIPIQLIEKVLYEVTMGSDTELFIDACMKYMRAANSFIVDPLRGESTVLIGPERDNYFKWSAFKSWLGESRKLHMLCKFIRKEIVETHPLKYLELPNYSRFNHPLYNVDTTTWYDLSSMQAVVAGARSPSPSSPFLPKISAVNPCEPFRGEPW